MLSPEREVASIGGPVAGEEVLVDVEALAGMSKRMEAGLAGTFPLSR